MLIAMVQPLEILQTEMHCGIRGGLRHLRVRRSDDFCKNVSSVTRNATSLTKHGLDVEAIMHGLLIRMRRVLHIAISQRVPSTYSLLINICMIILYLAPFSDPRNLQWLECSDARATVERAGRELASA